MNTTIKPFDDINVRKAVIAGFDRNALLLTRGGKLVGDMATHFLPPGIGRLRGGRRHEGHRRRLPVRRRQAAAGAVRRVLQEGGLRLRQVRGHREDPDGRLQRGRRRQGGRGRQGELREAWASRSQMRLVQPQTMYTRYCNMPVGEGRGLPERRLAARTSPTARRCSTRRSTARTSSTQGNSNWPELDDPAINKAMDDGRARSRSSSAPRLGRDRQAGHGEGAGVPWIWDKQPLDPVRERQRRRRAVQLPVGARLDVAQVSRAPRSERDDHLCGPATAGPPLFNQRVASPQNPLSNVIDAAGHAHRFAADPRTDASSATASESFSSASPARAS